MSKKADRVTIDIRGLRDRIENFRPDPAFQALSLAGKIRYLLELVFSRADALQQSIAEIIEENWQAITESDIDISFKRMRELREGSRPTDEELLDLGRILAPQYDVKSLSLIRSQQFDKTGEPNGTAG